LPAAETERWADVLVARLLGEVEPPEAPAAISP
jgi:hypothetical protein